MGMPSRRLPAVLLAALASALLAALLVAAASERALAEEGPAVPPAVRKAQLKKLGRALRKAVRDPHVEEEMGEVTGLLDAIEVLGGPDAAEVTLEAVVLTDAKLRDRVFAFVDKEHGPPLLAPLGALLEDKDFRRDADLRRRIARSLSVIADPAAVPLLEPLIRSDEDAEVVAEAAEALATYGAAPLVVRKDAVKSLVDLYTTTWNLMMSVQQEDKVIASVMKERWRVYHVSLRHALQSLTGQQLTRPQEWRTWWNKNKKRTDW